MGKILYKQHEGFGNRLKGLRKEKYKTQDEFADAIGKHIESVRNWEQGRLLPEMATLLDICETLDCDLDYLIGRIDCKTHDIQSIHEQTGLSENAIVLLKEIALTDDSSKFPNIISFILTNNRFMSILHLLLDYQALTKLEDRLSDKADEKITDAIDEQIVALWKISHEFTSMIEEDFRTHILNNYQK